MKPLEKQEENELQCRFLTREEAARFLGLSAQTLANLAWKNEGPPSIRLSRRCVRYDILELVAWMKAKEIRPALAMESSHA